MLKFHKYIQGVSKWVVVTHLAKLRKLFYKHRHFRITPIQNYRKWFLNVSFALSGVENCWLSRFVSTVGNQKKSLGANQDCIKDDPRISNRLCNQSYIELKILNNLNKKITGEKNKIEESPTLRSPKGLSTKKWRC